MKTNQLLEKFKNSLTYVIQQDDGSYMYDTGMLFDLYLKDPELPLIEEKLNKLMRLMEEEDKKGTLDSFMERDIETDVWFLL